MLIGRGSSTVELGVEFPHVVIGLICAVIGPGGWAEIIQCTCTWTRVAARDAFYITSLVTLQLSYSVLVSSETKGTSYNHLDVVRNNAVHTYT